MASGTDLYIEAQPYPWPYDGKLEPSNTALIVIYMQTDFWGKGGYIDLLGYDISITRSCIEPIQRVLAEFRKREFHIIHTREGHRPDLSDCLPTSAGARASSRRVKRRFRASGILGPAAVCWFE